MTATPPVLSPSRSRAVTGEVVRFDLTERLVHWTTALLMLVLLATGSILYIPSLMLAVGHRAFVVNLHVIAGFGLVAPLVIGLVAPGRRGLVEDLRRLDGWQARDFAWFRRRRRDARPEGKFNGGQKLAAAVLAGSMVVMIMTGVVMRFSPPFPNRWANGATFLHDLFYLLLAVLVIGHVMMALSRPEQLRSMVTGRIPRAWAARHEPAWLDGSDLSAPRRRRRGRGSAPPLPSARRDGAAAGGTRPPSG